LIDGGTGTVAWSNPSNGVASDDNRATAVLLSSENTQYLKLNTCGFSVPAGATIDGIVVEIEKSKVNPGDDITDSRVRIVKGGSVGSADKADLSPWGTTDAYTTYGGSADLWGETWTVSDINADNFGAAISAKAGMVGGGTARVDSCRITVYYTVPASQSPGCVAIARRPDAPTDPIFCE
jgi:hypothetical protein